MDFPKVVGIFATAVMLKYSLMTLADTFVPVFDGEAFLKRRKRSA